MSIEAAYQVMKTIRNQKLPTDSFFSIPISKETEMHVCQLASELFTQFIQPHVHKDKTTDKEENPTKVNSKEVWRLCGTKDNVMAYLGPPNENGIRAFKGVGEIDGTLYDVMNSVISYSTDDFRVIATNLYKDFLDCSVLHLIKHQMPDDSTRILAIKWLALQSPSLLIQPRDLCLLEFSGIYRGDHSDDLPIGYRIIQSIEIPECPQLYENHGFIRAHATNITFTFTPQEEKETVQVVHSGICDPKGKLPNWVTNLVAELHAFSISKISLCMEWKAMQEQEFAAAVDWVPNKARKHCFVCSKFFTLLRSKHHCRACGEVICGKCSLYRTWRQRDSKIANLRMCKRCILSSRNSSSTSSSVSSSGNLRLTS